MTAPPKVSTIIIVHDGEAFLAEAIDSVIAQSIPEWELLVVDDGSTDASREIARGYAAGDHRIRLIEHPDRRNHGMSATRNLGLQQACGEYIGFLDADDVWMPTKLEEQLAAFAQHPNAAMVYGRTLIWHEWSPASARHDFFYELGARPNEVHLPPVLFRNLLKNVYQTPTTCNALVRRSEIEIVGGFDPSFRGMFEDQVFFSKVLLRSPVFVSDRCWAKYRQHELSRSAVSEAAGEGHRQHVRYLHWLRRHLARTCRTAVADRLAVEYTLIRVRCRRLVVGLRWRVAHRQGRR